MRWWCGQWRVRVGRRRGDVLAFGVAKAQHRAASVTAAAWQSQSHIPVKPCHIVTFSAAQKDGSAPTRWGISPAWRPEVCAGGVMMAAEVG